MSNLKPWWKVAKPHADVREGKVGAARFAVKLMDVMDGEAPLEYQDPVTFFQRTYFTRNLEKIMRMVLKRLSKKGGENVIQLLTPFGGGKSHTLLALYHLFQNREEISHLQEIKNFVMDAGIEAVPKVNAAVIVGTYLNPLKGRTVEKDLTINTLWGEIAFQLGGRELYNQIRDNDEKKVSPGTKDLKKILKQATPALILMDEVTVYASKAQRVKGLLGETISFFQELTEAVSSLKDVALIVTLPASPYERADEAAEEMYEMVYQKVSRRFGRIEEAWTPVEDDEIHEVVRKRLFEDIGDAETIKEIVQAYWDFYLKMGDKVTHDARDPEIRKKMEKSYPFHPDLINILYQKWGSLPRFQRTRGVLRLLALVINKAYTQKTLSPMIQPCDVDFSDERITSEVMRYLADDKWRSVISNDITAVPPKIDKELGSEYEKERLSVKLARAIFLYSHGGQPGANLREMRVAALFPNSAYPEMVTEIVQRFEGVDGLWYLDKADGRYFFKTTPGLNKVIVNAKERVRREDMDDKIRNSMSDVTQNTEVRRYAKIYEHPEEPRDVADISRISIVLLDTSHAIDGAIDDSTEGFIRNIIDNYKQASRIYKNALILVVPDSSENSTLRKSVRTLLALEDISGDEFRMNQLNESQRKTLKRKLEAAKDTLPNNIVRTYRYLIKAKEKGELELIDMGITAPYSTNLVSSVWTYAHDEGIVYSSLDPALIVRKIWPKDKDHVDLKTVWESFFRFYGLPLPEDESVIKDSIREGVRVCEFGLARGNPKKKEYQILLYRETPAKVELTEGWYLITKELAEEIKAQQLEKIPEAVAEREEKVEEVAEEERKEKRVKEAPIKTYKSLELELEIPWERLSEFDEGVISPLVRMSDNVKLTVHLVADSEEGIDENTIEIPIKETLRQIKARILKMKTEES